MCNKKGFSLLSFLLYLMLFSIVTFFIGHIITVLMIPSFAATRKTQSIISLHIASDFFVRDIRTMREGIYTWQVLLPHELIWQKDNCSVGWCFSQNCLERREGIYDGRWQEAKVSIIAKDLSNAIFTIEKDGGGHTIGVELVLTAKCAPHKPIVCYVALKRQEKINGKP